VHALRCCALSFFSGECVIEHAYGGGTSRKSKSFETSRIFYAQKGEFGEESVERERRRKEGRGCERDESGREERRAQEPEQQESEGGVLEENRLRPFYETPRSPRGRRWETHRRGADERDEGSDTREKEVASETGYRDSRKLEHAEREQNAREKRQGAYSGAHTEDRAGRHGPSVRQKHGCDFEQENGGKKQD
jgi:ribosomal protein S21